MAEDNQNEVADNGQTLNEISGKLAEIMGEEEAKQYMPTIIGNLVMEMMKMEPEAKKQLTEDFKNPAFMRGAEYGMKMLASILETVMIAEERNAKMQFDNVMDSLQRNRRG